MSPTCYLLLLILNYGAAFNLLTTAKISGQVAMVYPEHIVNERDMPLCENYQVCNIIHRRFWLPRLVRRYCRCPDVDECSWHWSEPETDNRTMSLDNRSQIKFCKDVQHLPKCLRYHPAINVTKMINGNDTDNHKIIISCNCPEPHFWAQSAQLSSPSNEFTSYTCTKLRQCKRNDFCGHIRTDYHSTFYRCSCPAEHLCLPRDQTKHNIEEILYKGSAYQAYCLPSSQ